MEGSCILLALRCIDTGVLFCGAPARKRRIAFCNIEGKKSRFYKYPRKVIKQIILL